MSDLRRTERFVNYMMSIPAIGNRVTAFLDSLYTVMTYGIEYQLFHGYGFFRAWWRGYRESKNNKKKGFTK